MFWNWFEPWGFMNTERGHHESQFESLSQRLFGLTFWGDYGGDIITRWYHSDMLAQAPLVVAPIEAAHGQGLVLTSVLLDNEEYNDQLRVVLEFLAYFDPEAKGYGWGEMWQMDEFSNFEYELAYKEMMTGWWAEYTHGELVDHFADWEGNTLVPDIDTEEWGDLLQTYVYDDGEFYPYWESADSLIVPDFKIEDAAEWLLERYACSITDAGNPEVTLFNENKIGA